MNYFVNDVIPVDWDGSEYSKSLPGKTDWRELTKPLPCGDGEIPAGYQWNGASVGPLRSFLFFGFPKWKHPIATCRHDIRCEEAAKHKKTNKKLYKKLRKFGDKQFKKDVSKGGTWWEKQKGYVGVRIGSL